jgi:hypothetical protein
MPSSEDMIEARNEVRQNAIQQLVREGHAEHSAIEIAKRMSYDEAIQYAQKYTGKPIYRGPYSPYGG